MYVEFLQGEMNINIMFMRLQNIDTPDLDYHYIIMKPLTEIKYLLLTYTFLQIQFQKQIFKQIFKSIVTFKFLCLGVLIV